MPSLIVFSILIFIGSALGIYQYLTAGYWYGYNFMSPSPEWFEIVRYYFSWGIRLFGIAVATGILFKKEIFRKLGLWLAGFSIVTIYFKHYPEYFFKYTNYLTEQYQRVYRGIEIDFSVFAKDALVTLYVFELVFWALFIFYFTRSSIKNKFL